MGLADSTGKPAAFYEYDRAGNRLEKKFHESTTKVIWYASDTGATTKPTSFAASNQLKKMWTGSSKTTGDKINVGGPIADATSGVETVLVTNTTNSQNCEGR